MIRAGQSLAVQVSSYAHHAGTSRVQRLRKLIPIHRQCITDSASFTIFVSWQCVTVTTSHPPLCGDLRVSVELESEEHTTWSGPSASAWQQSEKNHHRLCNVDCMHTSMHSLMHVPMQMHRQKYTHILSHYCWCVTVKSLLFHFLIIYLFIHKIVWIVYFFSDHLSINL